MVWQRNLATFVLLEQGAKVVLDWFRLFDELSFYVTLIITTILDIRSISFIILILFVYIGTAMYMLQLNADNVDDGAVIPPVFGIFFVDLMINQFQLMMGAVETDGFEGHNQMAICYILYLSAMVISNVTFLNMLIAIMGDTFDRVIDQRPTYSLKNQILILAAYKSLSKKTFASDNQDVFIYVITPADDEQGTGSDDAWRGKLYYLQNLIKARFAKSGEQMQKRVGELAQRISSIQQQMSEKFEKNDLKDREIGKKLEAVSKLIKRTTKLGRAGKVRGGGDDDAEDFDDDYDVEDDDDNASNQSTGSAKMSSELVLATTAGYTDKVQGHKFELKDMQAAYDKVVNDWNLQG